MTVVPRLVASGRRCFASSVFFALRQVYGEDSYLQYYPLVLHSIVPLVASTLYTFLAKALNNFEEHPTLVRKKNAFVIKVSLSCCVILCVR